MVGNTELRDTSMPTGIRRYGLNMHCPHWVLWVPTTFRRQSGRGDWIPVFVGAKLHTCFGNAGTWMTVLPGTSPVSWGRDWNGPQLQDSLLVTFAPAIAFNVVNRNLNRNIDHTICWTNLTTEYASTKSEVSRGWPGKPNTAFVARK
jgi:hypothetical protein